MQHDVRSPPTVPQSQANTATGSPQQLMQLLSQERTVFIRGKKSWWQMITDFEARNKYTILDQHNEARGWIIETAGGIVGLLKRWLLKSHRPLLCQVVAMNGAVVLTFRRKFFFFFSDMDVLSKQGDKLGSAHRRFAFFAKRYDLRDNTGQIFATINSGFFRIWTFKVVDAQNRERAVITKKWGGAMREMFSDADTFCIDFGSEAWKGHERAVIFATAMSIDFDFFERNGGGIPIG